MVIIKKYYKTSWAGSATLKFQVRCYFRTRKRFGKKLCSKYARAIQNFWINKFWSKDFLGSKQFLSTKNVDKYHQDKAMWAYVTWTNVRNTLNHLVLVSLYCTQNFSFLGYIESQKKMGTRWVGGWPGGWLEN